MTGYYVEEMLKQLKALADQTRLRLALVLYRHELSVNELVGLLGMGQSRVSRHLKILAEAGLVQSRRDGLWVFYSCSDTGRAFQDRLLPLLADDAELKADLSLADKLIEERALKTRHFFNAIADDWDELNREVLGDFDLPESLLAALLSMSVNCAKAVDLGCGTGEVLEKLRAHCGQIIGVDGSPRMLELARRRFGNDLQNVSLRIGELDHLPLADNEADVACINLVLHHLSRPEEALAETARILKPGGRLLLADFDQHLQESMREVYGDRWLGFTREDLQGMLTRVGLTVISARLQPIKNGLALHLLQAAKQ